MIVTLNDGAHNLKCLFSKEFHCYTGPGKTLCVRILRPNVHVPQSHQKGPQS